MENDQIKIVLKFNAENIDNPVTNAAQIASAQVPDSNKPEKYVNDNHDDIVKVIRQPFFYDDTEQLKNNANLQS